MTPNSRSALGRFIQADSIVPGVGNPMAWDRYSYVRNNPIIYTAPSGHRWCLSKEECGEEGVTPYEGVKPSHPNEPWKDDWSYDETTDSLLGWNYEPLNDQFREFRANKVWGWLCSSGGWWGSGCPGGKELAAFLLWGEGGKFYDNNKYLIEISQKVSQIMGGYFGYLFEDADGITARDISKFTAFFDPKLDSSFNSKDWRILKTGPDPSWLFVSEIQKYYSSGPVIADGHVVGRWWESNEEYPCNACNVYDQIKLVGESGGTFYFGYRP